MVSFVPFRSQFRRCLHYSAFVGKKKSEKYNLGIKFKYSLQSSEENVARKSEKLPENWTLPRHNEIASTEEDDSTHRTKVLHETSVANSPTMTSNPFQTSLRPPPTPITGETMAAAMTLKRNKLLLNGEILFGISPVAIALEVGRREIHRLFLRRGSERNSRIEELENLAVDRGIRIEFVHQNTLDELCNGRPHQGVCLDANRLHFVPQETITEDDAKSDETLWLFLDKIHDPMNLGAILRSAYYFGVDRIVTVRSNTCPLTPVVSKASSGAMELLEVYQTSDSIDLLKAKVSDGWELVGTSSADGFDEDSSNERLITPLGEFRWPKKTVLLIGNEGLGLSAEHREMCHTILTVPPGRDLHVRMQSLNVGVATGVILQNASIRLKK